ncbi:MULTISPECIES: hypothetical protein [Pseudomonas]|uniref:Uncharacterized protein n=1 Tax=Pseudomonas mosselii TaxID=78327 RepID=A0A5R8ZCX0_9PSED|nr:hypothetical protein [Pseudomonas mosselii]TLP63590.1 hypothetical protein FEM01_08905 [Pseudomonas mosselii]
MLEKESAVRINDDVGSFRLVSAQVKPESQESSFSSILQGAVNDVEARGGNRSDEIGKILRMSKHRDGYADDVMKSYMNDLGGPLIDITDPDAIRFTVSGELVTKESMIYYAEMNAYAKRGYQDIYASGKAQGESPDQTFERFLEFNSSLPLRYKQMKNIWY